MYHNSYFAEKQKYLKHLGTKYPQSHFWINQLIKEIEAQNKHLTLKWLPHLNHTYPIGAQIINNNWSVVFAELLTHNFFFYFQDHSYIFDSHSSVSRRASWSFPKMWRMELLDILKTKGDGSTMIALDSKLKFDRIMSAINLLINYSNQQFGSYQIYDDKLRIFSEF